MNEENAKEEGDEGSFASWEWGLSFSFVGFLLKEREFLRRIFIA